MANLSNINNKFLVTTGGNVLIGQTSAVGSSILQVTGDSTFTGDLNVKNASTRFISLNYEDSINSIISHSGTSYGLESLNVRGDKIYFYTDYEASTPKGNITLTLENDHNAKFEGNVGIGISAGGNNLHIYKSNATALIQASNTSGIAQVQFFPRDASNVAHLQSIKGVDSNLTFLTGGNSGNSYVPTERIRIDSSGNTTITTTSNQGGLTVTSATDNTVLGINNTATGGLAWRLQSIGGGSGSGQGKLLIKVGGGETASNLISFVRETVLGGIKMGIGTTTPEQRLHVEGASVTVNRGNDDSSIAFQNSTSGATWRIGRDYSNSEALTFAYSATDYPSLTGNGLIYINTLGRIGIGTSTIPSYWAGYIALQLGVDNSIFSNTATGTGSALFIGQNLYNDGSNYKYTGASSNEGSLIDMRSGIISFLNAPAGTGTATVTERMRINSSGDVGIGTTPETAGPTWRTLFIGASATIVSRQAASGYDSIFANNYYVNSSNQDRVRTTGPSSRMFLDGNNIRFQISPSTGVGGSPTWSEIMRIDDSGNVGIGVTSPGEKLEVNGVIQIKRAGDHPAIRFVENTTTRGYIGTGDWAINGLLDADLGISSASTGSLVLGTNSGSGRVYIVNGGNVGIGITSPNAKLDVNGALKAQRFFSRNGSFSSTSGNWHNVVDLQQSEYENRTLICSVYTNGTHSYSSATVNVAYNGGNFVITLGNKISGGSTDIRISGAYLQFYTPWTSTGNFWRITIN